MKLDLVRSCASWQLAARAYGRGRGLGLLEAVWPGPTLIIYLLGEVAERLKAPAC